MTLEKTSVLNCGSAVSWKRFAFVATMLLIRQQSCNLQLHYHKQSNKKPKQPLHPSVQIRRSDNVTHWWHFLSAAPPEVILTSSVRLASAPWVTCTVLCPLFHERHHGNGSERHLFSHSLPLVTWFLSWRSLTAHLWKESTKSQFSKLLAAPTWSIPLCRAPEEADSWSSSQWDICISGLFFILSIFHSQKRGTLMSLKSHYGCCTEPAKADFLWFCSGAEEMREAKSPQSKTQKDVAGHEGLCVSVMHGSDCFIPSWRRSGDQQH